MSRCAEDGSQRENKKRKEVFSYKVANQTTYKRKKKTRKEEKAVTVEIVKIVKSVKE